MISNTSIIAGSHQVPQDTEMLRQSKTIGVWGSGGMGQREDDKYTVEVRWTMKLS